MSGTSERCPECDWKPTIGDSVLSRHTALEHQEELAASEREALLKAFGVSNGTQVWVEFQGSPDEMLATLHSLGLTRQSRAEDPPRFDVSAKALDRLIVRLESATGGYNPETMGDDPGEFDDWVLMYDVCQFLRNLKPLTQSRAEIQAEALREAAPGMACEDDYNMLRARAQHIREGVES